MGGLKILEGDSPSADFCLATDKIMPENPYIHLSGQVLNKFAFKKFFENFCPNVFSSSVCISERFNKTVKVATPQIIT